MNEHNHDNLRVGDKVRVVAPAARHFAEFGEGEIARIFSFNEAEVFFPKVGFSEDLPTSVLRAVK